MKIEQTECSETSAYKIQTPGNYPEENIQHIHKSSPFYRVMSHFNSVQHFIICSSQMHFNIILTVTIMSPN